MADSSSKQIDRQTTVPFHLKLFYSQNTFHPLSDFPTPNPGSDYVPPLPPHIQIYTWQSCTLRELATLLTSAIPSLLPEPAVGTRVSFRLIYPDTKGAIMAGPDSKGRYLSKDLGSVIIGASSDGEEEDAEQGHEGSREREEEEEEKPRARKNGRIVGEDADRTLQDMRFVIGDYVDCAIQAPLADGSVAPPLPMPRAEPRPFVGQ
ncbi:hypothetical protein KEM55_009235 [Ascosphaera atra]|nr:hypothetical protein KEM55_009235 [Ascosphaera atra]